MPLAITPTFRPCTHTSDDSYIYQLSLVVATATAVVSFIFMGDDMEKTVNTKFNGAAYSGSCTNSSTMDVFMSKQLRVV